MADAGFLQILAQRLVFGDVKMLQKF